MEETGFQINLFWVVTQAATFLIFLVMLYFIAFRRIGGVLEERRSRIEQGLRDADAARTEREQAAAERLPAAAQAGSRRGAPTAGGIRRTNGCDSRPAIRRHRS